MASLCHKADGSTHSREGLEPLSRAVPPDSSQPRRMGEAGSPGSPPRYRRVREGPPWDPMARGGPQPSAPHLALDSPPGGMGSAVSYGTSIPRHLATLCWGRALAY